MTISQLPNLLAEADPLVKFIGVAAVMAIWIIGLIVQSIKKQQETRRQSPRELAEGIRDRLPPVANRPPRVPKQKRPPPVKQKGRPNWQAIAVPPPVQQQRVMQAQPVAQGQIVQSVAEVQPHAFKEALPAPQDRIARKSTYVGAAAVHRWLKPATLQQQFILTELLQKPKCLRDD